MYSYLDKMQVRLHCGSRAMQRRADRPGPHPELRAHDLDPAHIGDVHTTGDFRANWIEQHVARRGHAAADHDAVDSEENDHVADPDAEKATGFVDAALSARVAGPRGDHRLLDGRCAASGRDRLGFGDRFEAAAVAAAAEGTVRDDGLVAELAGGALVAEKEPSVEHETAADPRAERDAEHRRHAASGAQAMLRERERARVVDETDGHVGRARYLG